jgi:holo-[acyl-carrier protein] synthase
MGTGAVAPAGRPEGTGPSTPNHIDYDGDRGAAARLHPGGVVSVGVDIVAVARFAAALRRTPALAERLFTARERHTSSGRPRRPASLAARFAAKEAAAKALGVPLGLKWHDCVVRADGDRRPELTLSGTVAAAARAAGISRMELSLTHDAGIAAAIVVAVG